MARYPLAALGQRFRHQHSQKMPQSALDQISAVPYLREAWKELYSKARATSKDTSGVDGVSLNDFKTYELPNLISISKQLREGSYKFSQLRPHFVLKPNGKERVICIGVTSDRVVQGAILKYLTDKYIGRLKNTVSYGFLRGRTVQDAVKRSLSLRLDQPWVFKTDIQAFFDNIDRGDLKQKVKEFVRDRSLYPLINQVIDSEVKPNTKSERRRLLEQGIKEGRGIRQGMALSPFLSNVVLYKFDSKLVRSGVPVIRYADDLIFFGRSRVETEEAEKLATRLLGESGFTIPSSTVPNSKSVHCNPTDTAEFLGIGIVAKGNGTFTAKVMQSQIKDIRKSFFDLASVDQLLARKITLAHLGRFLNAKRSGYIHAYEHCENLAELETALQDIQIKTLKRIYKEGLLIPVNDLSPSAYSFLGIAIS